MNLVMTIKNTLAGILFDRGMASVFCGQQPGPGSEDLYGGNKGGC